MHRIAEQQAVLAEQPVIEAPGIYSLAGQPAAAGRRAQPLEHVPVQRQDVPVQGPVHGDRPVAEPAGLSELEPAAIQPSGDHPAARRTQVDRRRRLARQAWRGYRTGLARVATIAAGIGRRIHIAAYLAACRCFGNLNGTFQICEVVSARVPSVSRAALKPSRFVTERHGMAWHGMAWGRKRWPRCGISSVFPAGPARLSGPTWAGASSRSPAVPATIRRRSPVTSRGQASWSPAV